MSDVWDPEATRIAREEGLDPARLGGWDGERFTSPLAEGRGTIDACVVPFVVPAAVAAAMLPVGLQLAPQPMVAPDRHVMFASFAANRFSAWFGDMAYHELLLGIPWVELADEQSPHRGPFIYMPRLLLDAAAPRILGERIYGFEKLPGRFTVDGGAWRVEDELGDLCAALQFREVGAAGEPDAFAGFAWVRKLLEMPTISQAGRRIDREARITCDDRRFLAANVRYLLGGVDWDGAAVEPTIQPISAELTFGNALVLPAGLSQRPMERPAVSSATLGCFRMRAQQVVSPPTSPDVIRHPHGGGRKLRVVVLGGGPAGCAAAYHLARQTDAYDVSLYTRGWRLGGKCAAGRNPDAHDRIEEHGLHALLGFYRNSLRTVAEVYRDAGREIATAEGPIAGAFRSQGNVGVLDRFGGRWSYFPTPMGPNAGVPGALPTGAAPPAQTVADALRRLIHKIGRDVAQAASEEGAAEPAWPDDAPAARALETLGGSWGAAIAAVADWIDRETDEVLERFVEIPPAASATKRWMIACLGQVRNTLAWWYRDRAEESRRAWFYWGGLDTLLTIAIGLLEESTLDFDDLDDKDMVAWLLEHGLEEEHAGISSILQVYETLFAHAPDKPYRMADLACGVGLRWFLLVSFGYDGYPAYDFRWSCPETLLTPYYEALGKLGAKVHFFHETRGVELRRVDDGVELSAVRMRLQATVKGGGTYAPLRPGSREPGAPLAWPMTPHYDQLDQGDLLRERGIDLEDAYADWPGVGEVVLRQGEDFDACVLAIPIGALPTLVTQLVDPSSPTFDPRWQQMLERISLTQTVSAQLWFDRDADAMFRTDDDAVEGDGLPRRRGLLTGFVQPQGSLGEMTALVRAESWPDPQPRLLTYHTGARVAGVKLPPPGPEHRDFPAKERAGWREEFEAWLRENHREIFDAGPRTYEAFLATLRVPEGMPARGRERLAAQAYSVACQPSDLYVLSRPGEMQHRLGQTGSGVRFMLLAGDWTKTDMNCGCVEAATQSGMLAARALSSEPRYIWRTGF